MARSAAHWMMVIAGLLACVAQAAEPEPLDEDFLEYLAELEDEGDNWTWFVSDDVKDEKNAAATPPVKRPDKRPEKVEP